jgi:hypothetical protein
VAIELRYVNAAGTGMPYWGGMIGILGDVEHWRAKAEQLRVIAEDMSTPTARGTMLDMADGYDRLAETMERRAARARERKHPA